MSALHNIPLAPGLITADEFEAMDLPDSCEWELIDGTVISVTAPDLDHLIYLDRPARLRCETFSL